MSRNDLMSDSFTIIRNAARVRKEDAYIPYSKVIFEVCAILKKEGYIDNFKEVELDNFKKIKVYLKYDGKKSVIMQINRVSTPGRRSYLKRDEVKTVLNGYGLGIISTSLGMLTDKEAKEKGVGGEFIGQVW